LRRSHLIIKALVVNETPGSTVPITDTVASLKYWAESTPIVALPRSPNVADPKLAKLAALL
jgi:hypothetical protein